MMEEITEVFQSCMQIKLWSATNLNCVLGEHA